MKKRTTILDVLLNWVKKVESGVKSYCETYGEWPKYFREFRLNRPLNEKERESNSIYIKIRDNGLLNGIKDDEMYKILKNRESVTEKEAEYVSVLENIQELYLKYSHTNEKSAQHHLDMLNKLEDYCHTYGEWPKMFHSSDTEKETIGRSLHSWCTNFFAGYTTTRMSEIERELGTSIQKRVESLYSEYGNGSVINKVHEILDFCTRYGVWPKNMVQDGSEKARQSRQLASWLYNHGYQKDFRYSDYLDEDGISLKEKLDTYYLIYSNYKMENVSRIDAMDKDMGLSIWKSRKSDDVGLLLYFHAAELKRAVETEDSEVYFRESTILKIYFEKLNVAFEVDDLVKIYNYDYEDKSRVLYELYTYYSIANAKELALMFKNLNKLVVATRPMVKTLKKDK